MPEHFCHALDCTVPVEPKFLMCRKHWAMVPYPIRQRVWRHYRPGQEVDKRPSMDYLAAMEEAIQSVRKLEEKIRKERAEKERAEKERAEKERAEKERADK